MFLALALVLVGDTPAAASSAEPEKKVCKWEDPEIGSNMPRKVCHTKAEWAAIKKSRQKNADSYGQNRSRGGSVAGQQGGL